jgi:hypothetical protein
MKQIDSEFSKWFKALTQGYAWSHKQQIEMRYLPNKQNHHKYIVSPITLTTLK